MNVQFCGSPQQVERRDESKKAKAMVAMQMGYKDAIQARELEFRFAELKLCPLSTIDHKEFVPHIQHLRRREMSGSGQCGTTPKDMQFEFLHR